MEDSGVWAAHQAAHPFDELLAGSFDSLLLYAAFTLAAVL